MAIPPLVVTALKNMLKVTLLPATVELIGHLQNLR
jgi:hypothetical protein